MHWIGSKYLLPLDRWFWERSICGNYSVILPCPHMSHPWNSSYKANTMARCINPQILHDDRKKFKSQWLKILDHAITYNRKLTDISSENYDQDNVKGRKIFSKLRVHIILGWGLRFAFLFEYLTSWTYCDMLMILAFLISVSWLEQISFKNILQEICTLTGTQTHPFSF